MADGTGATRTLAEFAATLTLDDVPAEVRHQAQRIIADTLSCVLAAYEYPPAAILERVVGASGGPAEATILPGGTRTGAAQAAYVNAELANLLDLDDNLLNHTRFANTAVAAPLAMAERLGASGPTWCAPSWRPTKSAHGSPCRSPRSRWCRAPGRTSCSSSTRSSTRARRCSAPRPAAARCWASRRTACATRSAWPAMPLPCPR